MPILEIEVSLSTPGRNQLLYAGPVQTRSSGATTDWVSITRRTITSRSERSSIGTAALNSHNSTFHKLIVKGLALYFAHAATPARIQKISLRKLDSAGTVVSETSVATAQISQIVRRRTDLSPLQQIDPVNATLMLQESDAGRAVLYSVTHLVKALDAANPFERFDRLWRAFNALYKALAKSTKDHDCHVYLAEDIRNHPHRYPLAIQQVAGLTAAGIRSHIRWNLMLQNNYPNPARTKALRDAILRTRDSRVLQIYRDSLPVRESFLRTAGYYSATNSHIQTQLATPARCDSDVVASLCIKYMYFVRNKIAHAERTDYGFAFLQGHAEEDEIRWLTPMLESLIIDLLNLSDTF